MVIFAKRISSLAVHPQTQVAHFLQWNNMIISYIIYPHLNTTIIYY